MPNQPKIAAKGQVSTKAPPPAESARAQRGGTPPTPTLSLEQRFLRAAGLLTAAYLCAVFLVHPLVFSNYYFNITETKQAFFLVASGVYLLLLLFARIALPPDFGVARGRLSLHPAVIAMLAFFAVSLVGGLISRYPGEVFFGENNRYQGLLTLSCYAFLLFAISRREIDPVWPERAFLLGACIVSVLGVLHHYGIDPLGFAQNLRASDRGRFLSTIGNADFYAGYIVLAFCVSLGFFLRARKRWTRTLSVLVLAIVSFGTLVAGSDSTALGLFAIALLFPIGLFSNRTALRRYLLALALFAFIALVFGLLRSVLPSATYVSAFALRFATLPVAGSVLAATLLLWLVMRKTSSERLLRLRKPYWISLVALVLLAAAALVLLNTVFSKVPLGGAARYLRFSPGWGTDRGKIWMFAARVYDRYTPLQKVFGAGPGALFHADAIQRVFSDAALDAAHNEYLQYLLVSGAAGLAAYLFALVFALRAGIRKSGLSPAARGLSVALAAYAVQAVVNIAQPMSTPLVFLIIGVFISRSSSTAEDGRNGIDDTPCTPDQPQ